MDIPPQFDTPIHTFASGYNWREKIAFIKNRVRPSHQYSHLTTPLPPVSVINQGVTPEVRLAFLGDVMPVKDYQLRIGRDVTDFLSDSDYYVINLEGIITSQERMLALSHKKSIVEVLHKYFPAEKTILYMANNHAGDFGYETFIKQYEWLKTQFFAVIGAHDDASVQIANGRVNVASVTDLSNQICHYVAWLKDADRWREASAHFNVLLPHWGYEMQLYPHPEQIKTAQKLLTNWNLIVGNHSHCVQPVAAYPTHAEERRAVAYSLGNFCYHHRWPHHRYGKIAQIEIGPNQQGTWQTGQIKWAYTRHDERQHELRVRTVLDTKYQGRVIVAQLARNFTHRFKSVLPSL
jgi:poly-gamma-glutamate capsule biosynthesis protein CapA/YwtB (metallophosphatase superfamily)